MRFFSALAANHYHPKGKHEQTRTRLRRLLSFFLLPTLYACLVFVVCELCANRREKKIKRNLHTFYTTSNSSASKISTPNGVTDECEMQLTDFTFPADNRMRLTSPFPCWCVVVAVAAAAVAVWLLIGNEWGCLSRFFFVLNAQSVFGGCIWTNVALTGFYENEIPPLPSVCINVSASLLLLYYGI